MVLLTTANVLGLANWGTFMLEASGTASSGGVGRHFQQERSTSSIYKMVGWWRGKKKSGRLVVGVLTTLPLLNNVVQLPPFTQGPHDFPYPLFVFPPSGNILFNLVHYSWCGCRIHVLNLVKFSTLLKLVDLLCKICIPAVEGSCSDRDTWGCC